MATIFVLASLLGWNQAQDYFLIRTVTMSVLVYEVAHPLLGKPTDARDMVATVLAGVFCEVLHRLLYKQPQSAIGISNSA